jgi:hypothetical protein
MFLSEEEIREMTHRVQRSAQARMLRSLGIVFKIRADGTLLVLRSHVEKEMGDAPGRRAVKEFQPNWSAANA